MWGLAMRLGGQMRVASGFSAAFLGWDMNAAFQMGAALGVDRMAVAIFLPEIEAVAMSKLNEQMRLEQQHE